ncbi:MAG: LysR family transcriptional regulator [Verrucomicrobia bacterium]|nr:LysR family transcriptional regulator [Verrucomicrobiota bacterium]
MQRVEAAFRRPLCVHERRQFRLTEEGRQLLPRAEVWLRQLRETVAAQEAPPLRLATTHAIARVSMPAVWSIEPIDLQLMRPDQAYGAVLRNEADIAIVLDNAPWEGILATDLGRGHFQLYSTDPQAPLGPILLPEDQMEVLTLQQRWQQVLGYPLPIKARVPSWSLIADLCAASSQVGFLPDFLARQSLLHPVTWQPDPSQYHVLALYRQSSENFQLRLQRLLIEWRKVFN